MTYQDLFKMYIEDRDEAILKNSVLVIEDYYGFAKALESYTTWEFSLSKSKIPRNKNTTNQILIHFLQLSTSHSIIKVQNKIVF